MSTALDAALDEVIGDTTPTPPAALPTSTTPAPRPTARPQAVQPLTARQQLHDIPPGQLYPDPENPREAVGDVTELAQSMHTAGLLQPIVARRTLDGRLVVVAGHRRLAAAVRLGWKTVPVIVRRDMRPDDVLAAMLIENGQRKDLDPIEEARALAKIKAQMGPDTSDFSLARRLGRANGHVSRRLMLLALPPADQDAIRRGDMTLTEAHDQARISSGRIRTNAIGRSGVGHLAAAHPLAQRAKARCLRLGHSRAQGKGVGGIACGACWESVIRSDEREHLNTHSATTGQCALCSGPYGGAA